MSWIVLCFGFLELSLVIALHQTGPALAGWRFAAALAGGVLLGACGLLGSLRRTSRAVPVALLSLLALLMLVETVRAWLNADLTAPGAAFGALLSSLLLVLMIGLLMYLLHGDRDAAFYQIPADGGRGHTIGDAGGPRPGVSAGTSSPPAARTRNRRVVG